VHGHIQPSILALNFDNAKETGGDQWTVLSKSDCPKPSKLMAIFCNARGLRSGPALWNKPSADSPWAAPKVWTSTVRDPYGHQADVFSLALCWINTFIPLASRGIAKMGAEGHAALRELLYALVSDMTPELHQLLVSMTEWGPALRPSASSALQHAAWSAFCAAGPRWPRKRVPGCARGTGRRLSWMA
jgi:serine/threonine protein kinase